MADIAQGGHDLFEIMRTTRSMRRLKPDPIPAALLNQVLEAGTFAANGGNVQSWQFLVMHDPPAIQGHRHDLVPEGVARVVGPRYRSGGPAPGTTPERLPACSRRQSIWLTICTKHRSGLCPVWRDRVARAHRSFPRCRTCCWRRARLAWAQR